MKTTFQHNSVQSLAIVKLHDGTVELRSKKLRATRPDWFMYESDHSREFGSIEDARAVAMTVCPIFHGSHGDVADFGTYHVDAWNHWFSM